MMATDDRPAAAAVLDRGPVGVICGSGSLPFVVADKARSQGRGVVLFPVRGAADAKRVGGYPHHWVRIGQFGRIWRCARAEGCHDLLAIGGTVRPTILQCWPDDGFLRYLPQIIKAFRGGDDRLLSGVAAIFERQGFRIIGAHEIAPEILMPKGAIGTREPSARDYADIKRGLALLQVTGPFDVGQAAVVADGRVLAIEAAEGTDELLIHLAEMRRRGRVRQPHGIGVLVKAPKPGQDRRFDLPSIGQRTVELAAAAGLAGIAVTAGGAVVAEADQLATVVDRAKLFVIGVGEDGRA
jgi:DUF1009 family protein